MKLPAGLFLLTGAVLTAADYRAGVARTDITPEGPIWLSGYASRTKPSEGILQPLSAKALALEDNKGSKVIIVTTDLIGLPRAITDVVGARVEKQYGVERARLLLNSSHTHTGPIIRSNLKIIADLDDAQSRVVDDYSAKLTDQLVSVIGQALAAMRPASLSYGEGSAAFAVNRREPGPNGIKIGVNPAGPVDHAVPVLKVSDADSRLVAVLFGYACHNTTLTGEHYKLSGDYAGAAQAEIEKAFAGTTAMYLQLCAGDQNPNPRSREENVVQHGHELAAEVQRVLDGKLARVHGRIDTTLQGR